MSKNKKKKPTTVELIEAISKLVVAAAALITSFRWW